MSGTRHDGTLHPSASHGANNLHGQDASLADLPPHIAALYAPGPGPFHTNLDGKLVNAPINSKDSMLQASVYLEDWLDGLLFFQIVLHCANRADV